MTTQDNIVNYFIPAPKKIWLKAVIWTRVSTQEQANEGYSLDVQMTEARRYCSEKGLDIIMEYSVSESASKKRRPEFYEMVDFLKSQKDTINLICVSTDRLHRFAEMNGMKNDGKIIIHSIRDRSVYDEESDDIKYHFEHVSHYSESRSNKKIERRPIITIDHSQAIFIQTIFELYSTGLYSVEQVRR